MLRGLSKSSAGYVRVCVLIHTYTIQTYDKYILCRWHLNLWIKVCMRMIIVLVFSFVFAFFYDTKMLLVAFSVWCKAWRHSTSRCSEIFCGSIIINLKFRKIVNCCACQMIAKTTFPEKF